MVKVLDLSQEDLHCGEIRVKLVCFKKKMLLKPTSVARIFPWRKWDFKVSSSPIWTLSLKLGQVTNRYLLSSGWLSYLALKTSCNKLIIYKINDTMICHTVVAIDG